MLLTETHRTEEPHQGYSHWGHKELTQLRTHTEQSLQQGSELGYMTQLSVLTPLIQPSNYIQHSTEQIHIIPYNIYSLISGLNVMSSGNSIPA